MSGDYSYQCNYCDFESDCESEMQKHVETCSRHHNDGVKPRGDTDEVHRNNAWRAVRCGEEDR
jgi:hypothetical protein